MTHYVIYFCRTLSWSCGIDVIDEPVDEQELEPKVYVSVDCCYSLGCKTSNERRFVDRRKEKKEFTDSEEK
jgi:hypothetical protein